MEIRDALVVTPESGTAVANLDLEEERSEGRPTAGMPQLINVLEAIPRRMYESGNGNGGF